MNDRFNSGGAWIQAYFYMGDTLVDIQTIQIFEEDLLDRTGREFRQLFAGKSTTGSRLYRAMESGCTIDGSIGK